ncbi:MAG TPA: ATP-binding protein [Gemmatimonadaceae bacterium]|nr:ATP-binding protein [Gemmatimonadaceae bacterium]
MMMPRDPLARLRLYAFSFALATALYTIVLIWRNSATAQPHAIEGTAAALLLGAWWVWGYRRGAFSSTSWLLESLLLLAAGSAAGAPQYALGLFFGAYQLRGLYAARRQLALVIIGYGAAHLGTVLLAAGEPAYGPLSVQAIVTTLVPSFVAVMMSLLADGMTRQAAAEAALQRSEERYRLVAGSTHDVICDCNVATGFLEWTESMQTVFGYAPAEVGHTLAWSLDRVHPEDRSRIESALAATPEVSPIAKSIRFRFQRADGRYATVSGTVLVQRDAGGRPVRVIGSFRDVTVEQQLEDELRQALKMEAVGQLAGGVAHDFNNLLTVIGGHVYLLRHRLPDDPVLVRQLDGIAHAADRGASLTKQLLTYSRKQLLTPARLNVNAVIGDVAEMMRLLIGEHIRLVTTLDPGIGLVLADAAQLGQLLVTLVVNARDAMPDGGTLTIETGTTTLVAGGAASGPAKLRPGTYTRLVVRDTGIGMDEETQARAFEPFFTTKPPGKGTGLGLWTVRGTVTRAQGDIRIESAPGRGAAFIILLPVTPSVAAEAQVSRPAVSRARDGEPERILLVEDDDGVREFAHAVLDQAGYRVLTARNGVEGLVVAERCDYAFDCVIADVVMPEMGGRTMVQQLRLAAPDLRVLFMSGYADDVETLKELRASDAALLEKPFTAEALTLAVGGGRRAQPVVWRLD